MKKFIFGVIGVIIVGIVVVAIPKQKKEESAYLVTEKENADSSVQTREDDSDRLGFWFPHHDSLNRGFVLVAEQLWRLDSAAANSNTIGRTVWYEKCEKALSHCFDSVHPGSNLPETQKADSMLTEIAAFFEQDADYTTMGMIVNISLQNDFLIYRTAAQASSIQKHDSSFVDEFNAWDGFQKALNDFCLGVVNWNWFGGSGAGPASLAERNAILQCRLDDLKRIHKQYRRDFDMRIYSRNDIGDAIDDEYKKIKSEFKATVEKVAKSIKKDENVKEYLSEDRLTAYNELFNKIHASEKPLIKAFDDWLKVRKSFPKDEGSVQRAANNKHKENTTLLIESLSKCVLDSQAEG
jgi:hypothetical protein